MLVLISVFVFLGLAIAGSSSEGAIKAEVTIRDISEGTVIEVLQHSDAGFKIVYLEGVDEYCPNRMIGLDFRLVVGLPRVGQDLFKANCYRMPSGTPFTVVADDGESTSSQAFVINAGRELVTNVREDAASPSRAPEDAPPEVATSSEPFGGQCGLIAPAALASTLAMTGLGSQNFDIDCDAAKKFVVNAGYRSFKEWIEDVENLFGFLRILDKDILTQQELAITDSLAGALVPGEMTLALARSDSAWFENTYSNLISLGVACDGVE